MTILVVTLVRWWWRRRAPLPPWAPQLSAVERTIAHLTERLLYLALIVMPATGIALAVSGDDDLIALHVASHLLLFAAVAAHLALVLKHTVLHRHALIRRMTR